MATLQTRALFERLVAELASGGPGFMGELFADDYAQHQRGVGQGKAGLREFFAGSAGALSETRSWAENVVVEGDLVSAWMCIEGDHTGTFFGVPATGRRVTIKTADTFRVSEGRFVEHWAIWDPTDYLEQMGALPENLPLPWPHGHASETVRQRSNA